MFLNQQKGAPLKKQYLSLLKDSAQIDVEDTLERLGQDETLMIHLLHWFIEDFDNTRDSIHQAFSNKDIPATRDAIHKLKGSAANAGAQKIHGLALEIEHICKNNSLEGVAERLKLIDFYTSILKQVIEQIPVAN